jgi:phage replication initiation protein
MDKIGKLDNRDYIRQLIERGQMNEEQQRIYEDYKKSFLLREERRIFDRTYTENDTDKESPYSE